MQMRHKLLFLLIALMAALTNCRKTADTSNGLADWAAVSELPAQNILSNILIDNKMYVLQEKTMSLWSPDGSVKNMPHDLSGDNIILTCSDYFVKIGVGQNARIEFFPLRNPNYPNVKSFRFTMADLGLDLNSFWGSYQQAFAINDKNQLLATSYFSDKNGSVLLFFEVKMSNNDDAVIESVSFKRVNVPANITFVYLYAIGDKFLATSSLQEITYSVDTSGNANTLTNEVFRSLVQIEGIYYADTFNGLFTSKDEGVSWTLVARNASSFSSLFSFISTTPRQTKIQNEDVLFWPFDMYQAAHNSSGRLESSRLDKVGLNDTGVLNVNEWRGRVYVFTPDGIFTRSPSDFFTPAL